MSEPRTYHGVWQVPDARGMFTRKFSGTLTYYGDKPSTLELIHEPHGGSIAILTHYDVILGEALGGALYTLFGVTSLREINFSKTTLSVNYILIGKHVKSLNEACFNTCMVKFPFLNRWALDSRITGGANQQQTVLSLDLGARPAFFSMEMEKDLRIMLWGQLTDNITRYSITANQYTHFTIDTPKDDSVSRYLDAISEFSHFLSIALFAEQHPSEIIFANKGVSINYQLLYTTRPSKEPWVLPLIKFDELINRIPEVLKSWHGNYVRVSPISHYLIRAISKNNSFDTPDFLTIAQALDGYFKRFVNNRDGKDTRQYKQQIEKLLKKFKGVDVIKKINLDAEVLTQTRHKYSHLIPDEEAKISKALEEGEPLYWLTQKCIVLLTCCILDMLGLSTEEINLCCNQSPIEQIVNSIPFWLEND